MGIKTSSAVIAIMPLRSEKPPHHMGIKTYNQLVYQLVYPLKNLPTTWGLRLGFREHQPACFLSEKPPHHMGIKTKNPT